MLQSIVLDRGKNLLEGVCTTFQADIFPWILFLLYSVIQNKKCTGTTLKKDNPRSWVSISNDCQVSLLYGGILDASSVLPGSVEWAGELKSLVSSPAGNRKDPCHGTVYSREQSLQDQQLLPKVSLKATFIILPCQVQTISVSPVSNWGTSVSCHTNKQYHLRYVQFLKHKDIQHGGGNVNHIHDKWCNINTVICAISNRDYGWERSQTIYSSNPLVASELCHKSTLHCW